MQVYWSVSQKDLDVSAVADMLVDQYQYVKVEWSTWFKKVLKMFSWKMHQEEEEEKKRRLQLPNLSFMICVKKIKIKSRAAPDWFIHFFW